MDQLARDVLELLRFSLGHPPESAHRFFPMFQPEQIRALYDIPDGTRERIWNERNRPEIRFLFETARVDAE
jgi:hypothetical protein